MAHEGIYATSAECIFKMGNGYNTTLVDEAAINRLSLQVESYLNILGKKVFAADSSAFTTLAAGTKYLLSEAASNFVGFYGIFVDVSEYNSPREAEALANLNWKRFLHCIRLIQEQATAGEIK